MMYKKENDSKLKTNYKHIKDMDNLFFVFQKEEDRKLCCFFFQDSTLFYI